MKIAVVTGSYPPDVCGVGDYSYRLVKALEKAGQTVIVVSKDSWHATDVRKLKKYLSELQPDIIHIQYPTIGYKYHLGPHLLSAMCPSIVTLHEVSQVHFLRRLSLYAFFGMAKHIIFTSCYENNFAQQCAPWIAKKSSIIPIGSNISVGKGLKNKDISDIIYFGLIRPQKGLEAVLDLADIIKQRQLDKRVRVVGTPDPRHFAYLSQLKEKSRDLPIVWELGLPDEEVASYLARCQVAYLPFPDGVSERRGSLLALLANSVAVVTTRGKYTPKSLEQVVEFAENPQQAFEATEVLLNNSVKQKQLSEAGFLYTTQLSWDHIAEKHIQLYEKIACKL